MDNHGIRIYKYTVTMRQVRRMAGEKNYLAKRGDNMIKYRRGYVPKVPAVPSRF